MDSNVNVFDVIRAVSLDTVTKLAKRNNGLGVLPSSIDGLNKLYGMRSNVIDRLVLKLTKYCEEGSDSKFQFKQNSYLRNVNLKTRDFGDYPNQLADIVEDEMLYVKNTFIPTVNELANEMGEFISQKFDNSTVQDTYDIKYVKDSRILGIVESEINQFKDVVISEYTARDSSMPAIDDMETIKRIIKTNNVVVDDAIDELLKRNCGDFWLDVYNKTFVNMSNVEYMSSLITDKLKNLDSTIFIYLMARKLYKDNPFENLKGNFDTIKADLAQLMNYSAVTLYKATIELRQTIAEDRLYTGKNKKNEVIITHAVMVKHNLDIETVLGAYINDVNIGTKVAEDAKSLRTSYVSMNNLYIQDKIGKADAVIKAKLMEMFDVKKDTIIPNYSEVRRDIASDYVYNDDITYNIDLNGLMSTIRETISGIITGFAIGDRNVRRILKIMNDYLSQADSENPDFTTVADLVALELIVRHLFGTHLTLAIERELYV